MIFKIVILDIKSSSILNIFIYPYLIVCIYMIELCKLIDPTQSIQRLSNKKKIVSIFDNKIIKTLKNKTSAK